MLRLQKYGDLTSVDLSYNGITVLDSLDGFTKLESLIVDSNCLEAKQDRLPRLTSLTTLCVNDNNIEDIDQWLTCVTNSFPSLTYLSMLKNPACPNYFIGKDQQDYARYRLFVLHRLPGLKFLDSSPVTAQVMLTPYNRREALTSCPSMQERAEAKRVGHLMRVARPSDEVALGFRWGCCGGGAHVCAGLCSHGLPRAAARCLRPCFPQMTRLQMRRPRRTSRFRLLAGAKRPMA